MYRYKLTCSAIAALAVAAGFALSFWPLSAIGLAVAAGTGQYALAIIIGIALDLAYGPPVGYLSQLHVPFTLLALAICGLYYFLSAYFREGESSGRI